MIGPVMDSSKEDILIPADQATLESATDMTKLSTKINALAMLDPLQYDLERKAAAKEMGVQIKTLDTQVKAAKKEVEKEPTSFLRTVDPYPDPVDPCELFEDIRKTIHEYIVLDMPQSYGLTLWVVMTWMMDSFQVAPMVFINAPERACGKTQLLEIMSRVCCKSLAVSNMSTAALFRLTEKYQPTLMIDEADTFVKDNKDMQGLINAGHTRSTAFAVRVEGDSHEPKIFSVYGAKLVAGIALEKHLPDSTMSRGLNINMRRKLAHESVARLRHADIEKFEVMSAKLARFALDYRDRVSQARPVLPEMLSDRAQDNWVPLLAIAECAGESWEKTAYHASLSISATEEPSLSLGAELLTDIREVFETKEVEKISSSDLINALIDDEERPWAAYNRGKPITPRQVATLLKGYGIRSKTVRMTFNQTPKGYVVSEFQDAFKRYLEPNGTAANEEDF